MKTLPDLTPRDIRLAESPHFDTVAELFADALKHRGLVHRNILPYTPVVLSDGRIETNAHVIPLHPNLDYVLTQESIGKMQRRGLGRRAVQADAFEILRTTTQTDIDIMRLTIRGYVEQDEKTYQQRPSY